MIKTIGLLLFVIIGQIAYGQTEKEKALEKALEAIKLMDEGDAKKSIPLLEQAHKLDPDNFDYPYELALAHYMIQDYKGAIKILEKNTNHKGINERLYQLLGNCYDVSGKSDKAFEAYDAGLKKFPNSGMIYLEKGNVYLSKKEYNNAIQNYEMGIKLDPQFPSNYYRATLLYCNSTEEVWGMIYGEIFMNLERNSKRTSEISKLLFDTYKSEIKYTTENSMSVSFSKNATIKTSNSDGSGEIKLPFGIGAYEPNLMLALINEKSIDINSLDRIRTHFLGSYFKNETNKKYPNVLFDYQKEIQDAGHLEAYNHWILMKGDQENFESWYSSNTDKWDAFITWFTENPIQVNATNKFFSGQY